MKILHIISSLEIGGAQKLVGDLLPLINKSSIIETSIAVFHASESPIEKKLKSEGITIINLSCSTHSPKAIWKLHNIIGSYDIIHVHLFPTNYITVLANIWIRKPIVFTEHSTHNRRRNYKILQPIEKLIYKSFSKIVCISNATENSLTKWIGNKIASNKIEVIENGIDIYKFQDESINPPEKIFGKSGIPLLMISRFTDSKDHPTVLHALKQINRPEIFVVFVGDGEKRMEVEQLAIKLGIEDRIIFLGNRNDISVIIKASKIGIQSSNWEGFGLTAIEMMAGGIPVIASDVDGLKQIVEGAGLIFKKGDSHHLAICIQKLLNSQDSYDTCISNGQSRVQKFSIQHTVDKHIKLYYKIISLKYS